MLKLESNHRPTSVTLLVLLTLAIAIWNGLRLVQSIVFWSILKEHHADPGPLYGTIFGGCWFLAGLSIAWGLWHGKTWAWFSALVGAVGYGSWYWFDRLAFQEPHSNWPFALVLTIISLSFLSVLFRRGPILFFYQKSPSSFLFFRSLLTSKRTASNNKNK